MTVLRPSRRRPVVDLDGVWTPQRAAGTAPDSELNRGRYANWVPRLSAGDVFSPPLRIGIQPRFGSCMGMAPAAWIERWTRYPVSGLGLWRNGRFYAGDLSRVHVGTTPTMVKQGLETMGWHRWHEGEDYSTEEALCESSPADDAFGLDNAQGQVDFLRITGPVEERLEKVRSALSAGKGVLLTSGLRGPFFDLADGEIASDRHMGGVDNGHAMAVAGVVGGKVVVQNSWGTDFAGATIRGTRYGGLFLAEPVVLWVAWDVLVFRVRA